MSSISNQMWSAVEFSHLVLKKYIKEGDIVVDATLGNGHDSLYLSQLVGEQGTIIGFDIQEEAIRKSRSLFYTNNIKTRYVFICANHASVVSELNALSISQIKGAVFNLGYMPNGDKSIVTNKETTIRAIEAVMTILEVGGCITIGVYTGHAKAREERNSVIKFASALDKRKWQSIFYAPLNRENPPECVAIVRVV